MLLSVNFLAVTNSFILVNCKKCIFRILKILFTGGFVIYYYKMCFRSFIHVFDPLDLQDVLHFDSLILSNIFWCNFLFVFWLATLAFTAPFMFFLLYILYIPDSYGLICFCISKTSVLVFCRNSFFGFCLDIFERDAYLAVDHNLVRSSCPKIFLYFSA